MGGPLGQRPAETHQAGGQTPPSAGSRQAPGLHHLILLHVGQGGPGGSLCGRGGSARTAHPPTPGIPSQPAVHGPFSGGITADPEVWLPSPSGGPALKRPQDPHPGSAQRHCPAPARLGAYQLPPGAQGGLNTTPFLGVRTHTGPGGWGEAGLSAQPSELTLFISIITQLHLKAEQEPSSTGFTQPGARSCPVPDRTLQTQNRPPASPPRVFLLPVLVVVPPLHRLAKLQD